MARSAPVALIALVFSAAGWSQSARAMATDRPEASPAEPRSPSRNYGLPSGYRFDSRDAHGLFAAVEVAPNTRIGLGMFGPKASPSYGAPVTRREIDMRRSRRAGVGFSLKF
jgi:hypothetical protein